MLVKLKLVGDAVSVGDVTVVPDKGTDKLGFEAFDVRLTAPLALLAEVGANVTVTDVLWPGVNVTGGVMPEMLNPVPDTEAAEIVALVPPVLVTVSV
ncbi:MAG TPA: hypothetical protein VIX19_00675 [Terriglobales bacterium]